MTLGVDTSKLHERCKLKNEIDRASEECEAGNGEEGIEDLAVTISREICTVDICTTHPNASNIRIWFELAPLDATVDAVWVNGSSIQH